MYCSVVVVVVVVVVVYLFFLSYLSVCLSIYLSIYLPIDLSIYRSFYLTIYLSNLSICLSASLKTKQFCETSSILEVDNKTKQFCVISSMLEVDSIKNEAILRDVLQIWQVECRAHGIVSMRLAISPFHLSEVRRLPRKSDARSYEVLCLSHKISLANLTI